MPKQSNVVPLRPSLVTRIERQIDKIFEDLETLPIPFKERVAGLYTIARLQVLLAKGDRGDGAGSAVRKYATAFRQDGRRGGSRGARPTVVEAPDGLDDDDDDPAA